MVGLKLRWLEEGEKFPCTECGHRATMQIETKVWVGHRWNLCDEHVEELLIWLASEFGYDLGSP